MTNNPDKRLTEHKQGKANLHTLSNMDKSNWNKTLEYYTLTHRKFPGSAEGLDWSERSQQARFAVLLETIRDKRQEDSILDVGCGYGDLSKYINWTKGYYGIDLNPEIIATAKKRYPNLNFRLGNLMEENTKYTWVLSSGAFNVKSENNEKLLQESIKKMWRICKKGVSFNVVIKNPKVKNKEMYFYDPGLVLNYCRSLTQKVICRMDYLPHDATFSLYR